MLKVSTPAAARMSQLLNAKGTDAVARIVQHKRRFHLKCSSVRPGDQTFAHDGRVVLALDERVRSSLSKRELNLRQTAKGPRLSLKSN